MSGCPSGKLRYRDRVDALIALSRASEKASRYRHQHEKRRESRAYLCDRCKGWHLTSQPARKEPHEPS